MQQLSPVVIPRDCLDIDTLELLYIRRRAVFEAKLSPALSLLYDMPSKTSTVVHGHRLHFSKAEKRRNMREKQERKGKKARPESKEPTYLHKSRNMPQVADLAAPGDAHAHEYDDDRVLEKLLPHGQEHRGCKSRDVDLRIKRDNKAVSRGVSQHLDREDIIDGNFDDFE